MIKDVRVRLDGTQETICGSLAVRLIAEIFDSHIIGLFFNILPPPPIQVRTEWRRRQSHPTAGGCQESGRCYRSRGV